MPIFLPNGIGETQGDALVTGRPFQASGNIYYVSSVTGDAASGGLNKSRPLNTLANAQTAASNGDTIVLLDGHTESLAGVLTISKSLTIVGSGSAAGVPTVNFQASGSGYSLIDITAAGVQLRNILFLGRAVSSSTPVINVAGVANVAIIGCYCQCTGNDIGGFINVAASSTGFRCENTTFLAANTLVDPAPAAGLFMAGACSDVRLSGLVFDGGTAGFSNGYGYTEGAAQTRRRAESISMLRGADASFHASTVQSFWMATTTSGDARMAG